MWGSVAVENLTLDSRILFCAITYARLVARKSLRVLYTIFTWSLMWLGMGVHPDADHEGTPFSSTHHPDRFELAGTPLSASGHVGVYSELRGDWKWQVELLCLESSYSSNFICHLCRAHKHIQRLPFTQSRRDSYLRRTRISWRQFRDWRAHLPEDATSPLLAIIGFTTWRCWVDVMHTLDLGVYQILAAACLEELVKQGIWLGATVQDQYYLAHAEYKLWCRGQGIEPCPRFERSRLFPAGEFPAFTQQSAKAHQTKHLMGWLYSVLCRPGVSEGSDHQQLRFTMFDQWNAFEKICARNGRFVIPMDRPLIGECVENALLCHNALAAEDNSLYHIVPKMHMCTHMAYDQAASGINPRRCSNYADEDMVGKVKTITQSCHGRTAGASCMLRYCILVGTRWWTRLGQLRGIRP